MVIKYFIFDLDGTIYQKKSVVRTYLQEFSKIEKIPFEYLSSNLTFAYEKTSEKTFNTPDEYWSHVHTIFLQRIGSNKRELLTQLVEKAKKKVLADITPRKGLIECLQKTKKYHIKNIIFSGSHHMYKSITLDESPEEYHKMLQFKHEQLAILGVEKYFEDVILTNKYGGFKPQKFVFESLLNELHILPSECIMIGDLENDMGAKQLGIYSILIGDKQCEEFQPDYIIQDFHELSNIINFKQRKIKDN